MDFDELLANVVTLLRAERRVSYRRICRQFELDDELLEDLKAELIDAKRLARDEGGVVLTWSGEASSPVERQPGRVAAISERREITVMFCDLSDSTVLAESLDPEDLRDIVVRYQREVVAAVVEFGGHVAQYLGDGILVYFGYPSATEYDADRAVAAALQALERLVGPKRAWRDAHGVETGVRIGVHSGLVVIGDVGSGERTETIALGDTPNTAARLQAIATVDSVVISGATARLLRGAFELESLGARQLKGLRGAVDCYRVTLRSSSPSVLSHAGVTPLIGRGLELEACRQDLERLGRGEGRCICLEGDPGIGKTRLLNEIGRDYPNLLLQSSPLHQRSAHHPLLEWLHTTAGITATDKPAVKQAKLSAYLDGVPGGAAGLESPLAALLGLPSELDRQSPALRRLAVQSGILDLLRALTDGRPLLVIWEDLHWVDPSSLALIELLIDESLPYLGLLLSFRPEFTPSWARPRHLRHLVLTPLDRTDSKQLALGVLDHALDQVVEEVCRHADGVPLFIEEISRSLTPPTGGPGDAAQQVLEVPATLRAALLSRLDRLGAGKAVAQLGSVFGRTFPEAGLRAIVDSAIGDLDLELDRLVAAHVLSRSYAQSQIHYTFRHALIRDAAYDSLLRSARRAAHSQIADYLRGLSGEDDAQAELLAFHCEASERWQEAVRYWRRAGERAQRQSAHPEAAHHFERALALQSDRIAAAAEPRGTLELMTALGASLIATEGYAAPRVGEVFREAMILCRQVPEDQHKFDVLQGLWAYHLVRGELGTAQGLAEQLAMLSRPLASSAAELESVLRLGITRSLLGRLPDGRRELERAVALYDPAAHAASRFHYGQDPQVSALCHVSLVQWLMGDAVQAVDSSRRALALAQRLDHPFTLSWAHLYTGMLHFLRRDPAAAREAALQLTALASDNALAYRLAQSRILLGWTDPDPARGVQQIEESLTAVERSGARVFLPYYYGVLAETYLRAGLGGEALATADRGLDSAAATGEIAFSPELHRLRGAAKLELGEMAGARADLTRSIDTALNQQADSLQLRSRVAALPLCSAADRGDQQAALAALLTSLEGRGHDTDLLAAAALLGSGSGARSGSR